MTSNESASENLKEKPTKVCPYLGLLQDSQTTLAFPSASNLCYNARPLASPNLEYQRSFCLAGRQHTLCPVFTRSELAPLPPEISGSPATRLAGTPVNKRLLLLILLACVVLILGILGMIWLFKGQHGSNAALAGKSPSTTPTSGGLPLATATFSITNIAITPNLELSATPATLTPSATTNQSATPLTSQTPTPTPTPTKMSITPLPIRTTVPCGSPNTGLFISSNRAILSSISARSMGLRLPTSSVPIVWAAPPACTAGRYSMYPPGPRLLPRRPQSS